MITYDNHELQEVTSPEGDYTGIMPPGDAIKTNGQLYPWPLALVRQDYEAQTRVLQGQSQYAGVSRGRPPRGGRRCRGRERGQRVEGQQVEGPQGNDPNKRKRKHRRIFDPS